jgi:hypothetical protein
MEAPIPLQPFPTPPSGPEPLPSRPGFVPETQVQTPSTAHRGE